MARAVVVVHESNKGFKVFEAELVRGGGGEDVGIEEGTLWGVVEKHGVGDKSVEVPGPEEFDEDMTSEWYKKWRRGMLKMGDRGKGGGEEVFEILEWFELRRGERGGEMGAFFEGGGTDEESGGGSFH